MILTCLFFETKPSSLQISENKKKLTRLVKVLQSECRQHQRTPPNQLACWGKILIVLSCGRDNSKHVKLTNIQKRKCDRT